MRIFFTIIIMLISLLSYSQTKGIYIPPKPSKLNLSGEKDQMSTYERFNGKIILLDSNSYSFNNEIIHVINTPREYFSLLESGIIYPKIFSAINYDNLTISELRVSGIQDPYNKKVRLILYAKGFANPHEYYFELTSEDGCSNTDFKNFIKGAKLKLLKVIVLI